MKISTFICITNPEDGNYPYLEAIESHLAFSDEVIIVDGGSVDGSLEKINARFCDGRVKIYSLNWPQGKGNWLWEEFSYHWNYGLSLCSGDWVCASECDHIFPEEEAKKVREAIERHGSKRPVLFVDKLVSSVWWKFQSKSKMGIFINKKEYPNIGYGLDRNGGSGQDLANPIFVLKEKGEFGIPEGVLINNEMGKNMGVYMWNYDKTFKTQEQIISERQSANWAWNNGCLVKLGICQKWEEEDVLKDVTTRMKARFDNSPYVYKKIEDHPKVIRERLSLMNGKMLGYNLFGHASRSFEAK